MKCKTSLNRKQLRNSLKPIIALSKRIDKQTDRQRNNKATKKLIQQLCVAVNKAAAAVPATIILHVRTKQQKKCKTHAHVASSSLVLFVHHYNLGLNNMKAKKINAEKKLHLMK